jgi:hypothetical protein
MDFEQSGVILILRDIILKPYILINQNAGSDEMKENRVGRRKFIKYSVVDTALTASSKAALGADSVPRVLPAVDAELDIITQVDVLVVGG